ncbi:hypothetical protein [Clostridium perfringens]|nr:hypothetical protein [Clostridium perfringens]MCI2780142.1 hypothetical protein [Clostridium perfringens]MDK0698575.1 hypothetical protein [Clostridium perfringens]
MVIEHSQEVLDYKGNYGIALDYIEVNVVIQILVIYEYQSLVTEL